MDSDTESVAAGFFFVAIHFQISDVERMAVTLATIQTSLDAAATAIEAGDFETARTHALAAKARLAGLLRTKQGDTELDPGMRDRVDDLITFIDKERSAATGISYTRYARVNMVPEDTY